MAKLTTSKRKGMAKREFAGPGRSFPINDKEHACLAISGATRSERAGNISSGEEAKIKAAARKKLGGVHVHKSAARAGINDKMMREEKY